MGIECSRHGQCPLAGACDLAGQCISEAVDNGLRTVQRQPAKQIAARAAYTAKIKPGRRTRQPREPLKYGPGHACYTNSLYGKCRFEAMCGAADQCIEKTIDDAGFEIARVLTGSELDAMAEQLIAAGYTVKPPARRGRNHKRVVRRIAADGTERVYEYPPYGGKAQ